MSVEQTENKGGLEQFVIPPEWQTEPVQPPPEGRFSQAGVLTPHAIQQALAIPRQKRIENFDIIEIKDSDSLEFHTLMRFIRYSNPSLKKTPVGTRVLSPLVRDLVDSRESQLVCLPEGEIYFGRIKNENRRRISESLEKDSHIARLLITAENRGKFNFLCRPRKGTASYFANALEIPGGILELTEDARRLLKHEPSSPITIPLSESCDKGFEREFTEEFSDLIPVVETRRGLFVTYVTRPHVKRSFLEAAELIVLDSFLLEKLREIGNYYRLQRGYKKKWQIEDIDDVLQEGKPMLPTLYAVLSRFKGQYVYEHEGWQIYGEYIPYNQTFFATRGKEITLASPLQG